MYNEYIWCFVRELRIEIVSLKDPFSFSMFHIPREMKLVCPTLF